MLCVEVENREPRESRVALQVLSHEPDPVQAADPLRRDERLSARADFQHLSPSLDSAGSNHWTSQRQSHVAPPALQELREQISLVLVEVTRLCSCRLPRHQLTPAPAHSRTCLPELPVAEGSVGGAPLRLVVDALSALHEGWSARRTRAEG
eukprot:751306-Hanusia_phi.AAC.4